MTGWSTGCVGRVGRATDPTTGAIAGTRRGSAEPPPPAAV
jgi:hypothetical protein